MLACYPSITTALLNKKQIKGQAVTIDAMGTQTAIAEKIRKKRADYVQALKGNQGTLHEDVHLYLSDPEVKQALRASGQYKRTIEKAHSPRTPWWATLSCVCRDAFVVGVDKRSLFGYTVSGKAVKGTSTLAADAQRGAGRCKTP